MHPLRFVELLIQFSPISDIMGFL